MKHTARESKLNFRKARLRPILVSATTVATALAAMSCGKEVARYADTSGNTPTGGPVGDPPSRIDASCPSANLRHWEFRQPNATTYAKSDLLFVLDTSSSLSEERSRVASTIPAFLGSLPENADLRIAVMLGHGSTSSYFGRLYAPTGSPMVLDSKTMSTARMQQLLRNTIANPPQDSDSANGEALMLSLQTALASATRVNDFRSKGFLRTDAGFTTVFVTDENDLCFDPKAHGFTAFPDFVASKPASYEENAYKKNCLNSSGSLKVTPESTLAALQALQGQRPLAVGGIVHSDPAKVPTGGEDAIGHGVIELVKAAHGTVTDLSEASYDEGLSNLAKQVSTDFKAQTSFTLSGKEKIRSGEIVVKVDGKAVFGNYDPSSRKASITVESAGGPQSLVQIDACVE